MTTKRQQTIGFFGGTFDPIHFGHLNLAIELKERAGLDKVLFCPARCSPFKSSAPPIASPEARFAMVEAAISGIEGFQATRLEIDRQGPSYTIDTLRQLAAPDLQFRLILAEEALPRFHLWKEAFELLRLAPPLIGARGKRKAPPLSHRTGPLLARGLVPTRILEISSTEVRERLSQGLYSGHLVPQKTLDYITAHRLYSPL
jgi:nicotinate-nucleotide adenylyltransferase